MSRRQLPSWGDEVTGPEAAGHLRDDLVEVERLRGGVPPPGEVGRRGGAVEDDPHRGPLRPDPTHRHDAARPGHRRAAHDDARQGAGDQLESATARLTESAGALLSGRDGGGNVSGRPQRALGPCQALTYAGKRCRRSADYLVTIGDRPVALCGSHARQTRVGAVGVWTPDRPPLAASRTRSPWALEDDAYVAAHDADPIVDVARHLGRTVSATQQRRRLLRQIEREGPR